MATFPEDELPIYASYEEEEEDRFPRPVDNEAFVRAVGLGPGIQFARLHPGLVSENELESLRTAAQLGLAERFAANRKTKSEFPPATQIVWVNEHVRSGRTATPVIRGKPSEGIQYEWALEVIRDRNPIPNYLDAFQRRFDELTDSPRLAYWKDEPVVLLEAMGIYAQALASAHGQREAAVPVEPEAKIQAHVRSGTCSLFRVRVSVSHAALFFLQK